ncbi:MAG: glycosyltransferase [Lacunisphaera sp.]|jgi:hypothetical protein|nr:glycosyltransferase [Lacunisphaera sp.]
MSAVTSQIEQARWVTDPYYAIQISGWGFFPDGPAVAHFEARVDDRVLATAPASPRPDVQQHFAGTPAALHAGFLLKLPWVALEAEVRIAACRTGADPVVFHRFRAGDLPGRGPVITDYAAWSRRHDPEPAARPASGGTRRLFSILLPVYRTPPPFLRDCLASVQAQTHPHWELIVVDDGSTQAELTEALHSAARAEPRIHLHPRATNGGIARATNDALAAAAGEYVVLLDHDDLLRPHALAEFDHALQQAPLLDAVYSDEDKIDADGGLVTPILKPGFSPEFLLGVMYVGHALCVRTAVARQAGGFDPAFDGIQDFEFLLRVTEITRRIGHLPRILYHWRQSPGSTALHGNIKGDMDAKQAAAIRAHLTRCGRLEQVLALGAHRVRLTAPTVPSATLVRVASGMDPLAELRRAAAREQTELLLLLSAEPLAGSDDWVRELSAVAALPDTGCAAPVLLSIEQRVLASGCTLDAGRLVPLMRGFDPAGDGYNGSLPCTREVGAVSAHCVALRRSLVIDHPAENWADFLTVLAGTGLFHRVSGTARIQLPLSWVGLTTLGHSPTGIRDPYYSDQFATARGDYSLAHPPASSDSF